MSEEEDGVGLVIRIQDDGRYKVSCGFCAARSVGHPDDAIGIMKSHLRREHPDYCTMCKGQGTIPRVPEPMPCPACRG